MAQNHRYGSNGSGKPVFAVVLLPQPHHFPSHDSTFLTYLSLSPLHEPGTMLQPAMEVAGLGTGGGGGGVESVNTTRK